MIETSKLKVYENMSNCKHTIVFGPHGIGKSYAVSLAAKQLKLFVVTVDNTDNLHELAPSLVEASKSILFEKTLFLFEEAENLEDWNVVEELVKQKLNPVFLIMNEVRNIPPKLKSKFEVVRYPDPTLQEVVAIVKTKLPSGMGVDFRNVTQDIRQSILNTLNKSENYSHVDLSQELEDLFTKGVMSQSLEENSRLFLLVLDNLTRFYFGPDLVRAYETLSAADFYDKPQLLTLLPRGKGKAAVGRR